MSGYMTALENMNKEAVEFVRGIPVVKVFDKPFTHSKTFMQRLKNTKNMPVDMQLAVVSH